MKISELLKRSNPRNLKYPEYLSFSALAVFLGLFIRAVILHQSSDWQVACAFMVGATLTEGLGFIYTRRAVELAITQTYAAIEPRIDELVAGRVEEEMTQMGFVKIDPDHPDSPADLETEFDPEEPLRYQRDLQREEKERLEKMTPSPNNAVAGKPIFDLTGLVDPKKKGNGSENGRREGCEADSGVPGADGKLRQGHELSGTAVHAERCRGAQLS